MCDNIRVPETESEQERYRRLEMAAWRVERRRQDWIDLAAILVIGSTLQIIIMGITYALTFLCN